MGHPLGRSVRRAFIVTPQEYAAALAGQQRGPQQALSGGQVGGAPQAVPRQGFNLNNALSGLMGSPAAMTGLGLLSAGFDSRVNPVQAGMQGLMGASHYKREQEKQKLEQSKRKETAESALRLKNSIIAQAKSLASEGGAQITPAEQQKIDAADYAIATGDNSGLMGIKSPIVTGKQWSF